MRWSVKITNFFLLSFGYCILGNYIKEITKRPVIRCTCSSNHVIDVKRASWIAISARCAHISAWTLTFPNKLSAHLSFYICFLLYFVKVYLSHGWSRWAKLTLQWLSIAKSLTKCPIWRTYHIYCYIKRRSKDSRIDFVIMFHVPVL